MSDLVQRACPVCGAGAAVEVHRHRFSALAGVDLDGFEQTLLSCEDCGTHYVGEYLSPAALARYYAHSSSYEYLVSEQALPREEAQRSQQQHAFLRPYLKAGARVLDVGCSTGYTLSLFAEDGHQAHGIEPSSVLSQMARERYGLRVDTCFVERADQLPPGQDLVMLSHVLEHLMAPAPMLAAIRASLGPGGRLFIEIPVIELFDERDLFQLSFEHVNYFSHGSLSNLMHRCGFREVEHQVFENDDGTSPHYPTLASLWEVADDAAALPRVNRARHDRAVLRRYLQLVARHTEQTDALIRQLMDAGRRVAIWGGGTLTAQLLAKSALGHYREQLLGILDVDPKKHGLQMQSMPVWQPDSAQGQALLAGAEAVIIGSWSSQDAIHAALRQRGVAESRIVRLFSTPH